jgi:septum formation protein
MNPTCGQHRPLTSVGRSLHASTDKVRWLGTLRDTVRFPGTRASCYGRPHGQGRQASRRQVRWTVITRETPLVLGSASPRRRAILEGLGLPIVVEPPAVQESPWKGEPPTEYVSQVVYAKLRAISPRLQALRWGAVLVADTIVVIRGRVLGKPASLAHAEHLLTLLAGDTHTVFTGYALAGPQHPETPLVLRTVRTEVTMRSATREEIARYARTGEGLDKAGAYAVQGIGAFLVQRIEGSCSNVVGLPACELVLDLGHTGLLGVYP